MIGSLPLDFFCLVFCLIAWPCKKKISIVLSSTEVEYWGVVLASQEVFWLHQLMTKFGFPFNHPTTLWYDNQSSIHISHNPMEHQHTKHIEIHMHFIRKLIQDDALRLEYFPTNQQVLKIFTKPLAWPCYLQLWSMLGVKEIVLGDS